MRVNSLSFINNYKNFQNTQKTNQNTTKNNFNRQTNVTGSLNVNFKSLLPFVYYISSEKMAIKEKEIKQLGEKIRNRNSSERLAKALNVSNEEALEYYTRKGAKINPVVPIDPKDSTAKRLNDRSIHDLRHKLILPIFYSIEVPQEINRNLIPDGVILKDEGGINKNYIMDNLCKNCERFDMRTIEIDLDEKKHNENAKKIKKAFKQAEEYFKETGNYTFIKVKNNLDKFFTKDSLDSTYYRELGEFSEGIKDCSKKGIVWIGCADNADILDDSLTKGKILQTSFEEVDADNSDKIIKYCFRKYDDEKTQENFKYETIKHFLKKYDLDFTLPEYDYFIKSALSYPRRKGVVSSRDVINIMAEYANYRYLTNIDPSVPFEA